ncbi:sporulation initiation factor Spo0A C-terminal domain-containing protein [Alicyclobacillus fodiniaquatilis]|uniref:Sporulation initiation factor Spo0A C-terminal domain-containing protein n=1 Tax=Alicyclobacillus fodiniaquatilis TaxID=1661150 RepID=A0ABW4JGS4_9BACL
MNGRGKWFDHTTGIGTIAALDGHDYTFKMEDVHSGGMIEEGDYVQFVPIADDIYRANHIRVIAKADELPTNLDLSDRGALESLRDFLILYLADANVPPQQKQKATRRIKEQWTQSVLSSEIRDIIHQIGIPVHIKGYFYISDAVRWQHDEVSVDTKEMYKALATKYKTTPSRVQRAVRHAVITGWGRGSKKDIQRIFGYDKDLLIGPPSNEEFITQILRYVREQKSQTE